MSIFSVGACGENIKACGYVVRNLWRSFSAAAGSGTRRTLAQAVDTKARPARYWSSCCSRCLRSFCSGAAHAKHTAWRGNIYVTVDVNGSGSQVKCNGGGRNVPFCVRWRTPSGIVCTEWLHHLSAKRGPEKSNGFSFQVLQRQQ